MKLATAIFSRQSFLLVLNSLLVFILLFMMLPVNRNVVSAQSEKNDANIEALSDNVTLEEQDPGSVNVTGIDILPMDDALDRSFIKDIASHKDLSERNIVLVNSENETAIKTDDGKLSLHFPQGAVNKDIAVEMTPISYSSSYSMKIINVFELNAWEIEPSDTVDETLPVTASSSQSSSSTLETPSYVPCPTCSTSKQQLLAENITGSSGTSEKSGQEKNGENKTLSEKIETASKVTSFEKQLTLDINFSIEDLQGIDLNSLGVYYLDEETLRWLPVESQFNAEECKLTATLDHFSVYSTQANPLENGPGRIMANLVNLHSGTTMYTYPLELLPGPGGFQPELKLSYNSGSIDEMKNKRDVGSWVGTGWDLSLGKITLDLTSYDYYLELSGVSYKLITWDGTEYFTSPDEHLKITRSGNTWTVLDRSGNSFRFGGTADSEQYLPYSTYYRWDLNRIQDTNGNTAVITYTQDILGDYPLDWVRSSYPTQMSYGNVKVYFHSSYDETTGDGNVRYDNPISAAAVPAPMIMENRRLDSVEVKMVDGTEKLVRKYAFNYYGHSGGPADGSANRTASEDYGGISYAGKFKLYSITEMGCDGTSTLPATTFTYQDKPLFRQTDEGNYTGNPGNPASLSWPWLTRIDNGYGGVVNFTYEQKPGSSPEDIWTRQVITGKTIQSGIGVSQSLTYEYTGDPQYGGTGWDQKYNGFSQVTETDSEDNYTEHYYYTSGNLSGKEYETDWYDSDDTFLKKVENTWESVPVGTPQSEGTFVRSNSGGTLSSPWGIDAAIDGSLYVASTGTNRIVKYDANMTYQSSPFDSITINSPRDCAVSADGYIYVTSGNYVYKYDLSGNLTAQFGNAYLSSPYGIAVSSEGALGNYVYVASTVNRQVVKFSTNGTYMAQYSTGSYTPYDVSLSPSGDKVYIGAAHSGVVVCGSYWDSCCYYDPSEPVIIDWDCHACYCCYMAAYPPFPEICGYNNPPCGECCDPIWAYPQCVGCYLPQYCTRYYDDLITLFAPTMGLISQGYVSYCGSSTNSHCIEVTGDGSIYASIQSEIKNIGSGVSFGSGQLSLPKGITNGETGIYVVTGNEVKQFTRARDNSVTRLAGVEETTYGTPANKTINTEYVYDDYGNVITVKYHGDTANNTDDRTIWRSFNINLSDNILDKPASERTYATIMATDSLGANLRSQTLYYYDSSSELYDAPDEGNLTKVLQSSSGSDNISEYNTYDAYGNILTTTDPNGNTVSFTYDASHTYVASKTLPLVGTESYACTWHWVDAGSGDFGVMKLTTTDVNGQISYAYYDRYNRPIKTVLTGDTYQSPTSEVQYNDWGTTGNQSILTQSKIDAGTSTWQKSYFDGLGRVIQTHAPGETGYTEISGTTIFDTRGLVEHNYTTATVASAVLDGYLNPYEWHNWLSGWDARIQITLDSSKIDDTLTHFPILLYLGSECGTNAANTSQIFTDLGSAYNKIAVTKDDGQTQLYVEVEKWDANNEEAWLWVSRDNWTIDDSEDTVLYLYYDNQHAVNDTYIGLTGSTAGQSVWDSNYRLVDHMNDDPDTSHTADSTDYENDGTKMASNEPLTATAMIGNSLSFDGTDDYILYADDNSLEPGTAVSVESIFKTTEYENAGHIYRHSGDPYHRNGERMYVNTDKAPMFWVYSDAGLYAGRKGSTDVADNNSHYVVGTYDTGAPSDNLRIYVDGFQEGPGANVTMPIAYDSGKGGYVGKCGTWDRYYYEGTIDEFRLSGIARSPAWIKATYYTCWDNLVSYSTEQSASGPAISDWKYSTTEYDALGRVVSVTNADGTEVEHDYSVTWADYVTNPRGYETRYYYDAFSCLVEINEYNSSDQLYTTLYQYDTLGNLVQVTDEKGNITGITYDWLSRKTGMVDPDMGSWSYLYDNNGNLVAQTDAVNQTVNMTYDALNRVTGKTYPAGSGMTNIVYSYDSGANGKGHRTGMVDAAGTVSYVYDARGRLVTETRTADSIGYSTGYTYDGLNRITSITYPTTGETVTQTYNTRGLPQSLSGNSAGNLVTSTKYNSLGSITEINLGNGLQTTWGYYGTGGEYDTSDGYYGKLWRIKTLPQAGGAALMDVAHSWDANGNLSSRFDVNTNETEVFSYDFLDRLTAVSGNYSASFTYDEIGNMMSRNGLTYTYNGTQPHAVDSINGTVYTYDANGNMYYRESENQTIIWDAENRPEKIITGNSVGIPAVKGSVQNPYLVSTSTLISMNNPMETNGVLDTVEIYVDTDVTGLRIGSFFCTWEEYHVFECRDSETIGSLSAGYHIISGLSINIAEGDLIGCYFDTGTIALNNMESGGTYHNSYEFIDPGDDYTYSYRSHVCLSLRGIVSENTTTFVYDGDGNRIKKTENGDTVLYIGNYYEKNFATGNITTSYYLGSRLVAQKEGTELRYVHQDHLTGTSLMTSDNGTPLGIMKYEPYGSTRSGSVPTDRMFTGQRHDGTGLYYYGARYYDPEIGRFISPDTIVPDPMNPQSFNRYSYCLNNPLRYVDPSGYWGEEVTEGGYLLDPRTGEVIPIEDFARPYQPKFPALTVPIPSREEPDLPVDTELIIDGGYSEEGAFGLRIRNESIVVHDTEGNYYHIQTNGWGAYGVGYSYSRFGPGGVISEENFDILEGYGIKYTFGVGILLGFVAEKSYSYDGHDTYETGATVDTSMCVDPSSVLGTNVTAGPIGTYTTITQIPNDPDLIYKLTTPLIIRVMSNFIPFLQ